MVFIENTDEEIVLMELLHTGKQAQLLKKRTQQGWFVDWSKLLAKFEIVSVVGQCLEVVVVSHNNEEDFLNYRLRKAGETLVKPTSSELDCCNGEVWYKLNKWLSGWKGWFCLNMSQWSGERRKMFWLRRMWIRWEDVIQIWRRWPFRFQRKTEDDILCLALAAEVNRFFHASSTFCCVTCMKAVLTCQPFLHWQIHFSD